MSGNPTGNTNTASAEGFGLTTTPTDAAIECPNNVAAASSTTPATTRTYAARDRRSRPAIAATYNAATSIQSEWSQSGTASMSGTSRV